MRMTHFVLLALIIGCSISCASQAVPAPETKVWVADRYDGVASRIFGAPIDEDGLAPDVAWVVTVRRRPAGDIEPEVQFSITRLYTGGISANVVRLREPLSTQLRSLHSKLSGASDATLASSVVVDRVHLSAAGCPSLGAIAEEFSRLQLSPVLENEMVLDPIQYQVWIDGGSQQAYFNLLGASSGEGGHPFVAWIERALRDLWRCEGRRGE